MSRRSLSLTSAPGRSAKMCVFQSIGVESKPGALVHHAAKDPPARSTKVSLAALSLHSYFSTARPPAVMYRCILQVCSIQASYDEHPLWRFAMPTGGTSYWLEFDLNVNALNRHCFSLLCRIFDTYAPFQSESGLFHWMSSMRLSWYWMLPR